MQHLHLVIRLFRHASTLYQILLDSIIQVISFGSDCALLICCTCAGLQGSQFHEQREGALAQPTVKHRVVAVLSGRTTSSFFRAGGSHFARPSASPNLTLQIHHESPVVLP